MFLLGSPGVRAQETVDPNHGTLVDIYGQSTIIWQNKFPMVSPYSGPNSLPAKNEAAASDSFSFYVAGRLGRSLELYASGELLQGTGIGRDLGVAGYLNGEITGDPNLNGPLLQRCNFRYTVPLGQSGYEAVAGTSLQVPGSRPRDRLVITAGKLSVTDIFDTNAYANDDRSQFINAGLCNNLAYDYAADTTGYGLGGVIEILHPSWALHLATFQMPLTLNGEDLSNDLAHFRGDQVQLDLHPRLGQNLSTLRLLAYENHGRMGDYAAAVALAVETGRPPDISTTRRFDATRSGYCASFDLPVADDGNTGLFCRLGFTPGTTENFVYTEAESTFSVGGQVSGKRWHRPDDNVGLGYSQAGLNQAHQEFLALGGVGAVLGDGQLNYGAERIVEGYYSRLIGKGTTLTGDLQFVQNPGYNRDRGPAFVPGIRFHIDL